MDAEGEDVAGDEEFGEPVGSNDGVGFRVCGTDDAAESHVDCCCEEGGRDEDEEGLEDVGD